MDANELNDLGKLIDCSEQDFTAFCEKQNLGYLLSLRNLLTITYNQVLKITDDLINKCKLMTKAEMANGTYIKTLEGLHSKMLQIDFKFILVTEIIEKRKRES